MPFRRHWSGVAARAPKDARTDSAGNVFDSAAEMARWNELLLMQRAGEISNLRRQVKFDLVLPNGVPVKIRSPGYPQGRACSHKVDFQYTDRAGKVVLEEWKGFDTPEARLRRAVVEALTGHYIVLNGPAAKRKTGRGTSGRQKSSTLPS